jgi:hypothetical protein
MNAYIKENLNYAANLHVCNVFSRKQGKEITVGLLQKVGTGYIPKTLQGVEINRSGKLSQDSIFNILPLGSALECFSKYDPSQAHCEASEAI